jgi:hypothetical protein
MTRNEGGATMAVAAGGRPYQVKNDPESLDVGDSVEEMLEKVKKSWQTSHM